MPVPVVLRECHREIDVSGRSSLTVGPEISTGASKGRVGIRRKSWDSRCHFLQQPGAGSLRGGS